MPSQTTTIDSRLNDADWLRNEYATKSLQEIADVLGCCRETVRKRFVALGIQTRKRGEHFKGTPKTPEQRRKMSEARRRYWENRSDPAERNDHRLKVSKAKTKTGMSSGRPYVYILGRGRVREHRIVVEQHIGRPLLPDEHVHHKDMDKTNNDPDNLEVMTNSEHARLHMRLRLESKHR